jgi:RHS repeat-associated protein
VCIRGVSSASHFTGKERDTESGNDYFEARYYSSAMGRFMSPDWSAKEEPVPYATMDDPQSLNLYAYVRNNPLTRVDADGHWGCQGSQEGFCSPAAQDGMRNGMTPGEALYAAHAAQQQGGDPTLPTAVQEPTNLLDKALGPTPQNMLMVATGDLGELGEAGKALSSVAEESVSVYQKAETAYVGITSRMAAREAEHGEPLVKVVGDLTRKQARGVEQAIIDQKGLVNLTNKINSIAKTNPIYQEAVQFGRQLLQSIGFQ